MNISQSLTLPLISCVILLLLSTLTSAKLVFIGSSHSFDPCPTKPDDPIFEFKANGNENFINYAVGLILRNGHPAGRFNATQAGEDITYALSKIVGPDGGMYKCDYGTENDPKMPLTVIDSKTVCPASLGPVNMGERLTGDCSILKQGSENITVKWKFTDIIQNSVSSVELTKVISGLDIEATPSLNGQEITCFMDDIPGVTGCTVRAEVNYPPQNVVIEPAVQAKLSGQEAKVDCTASDANPSIITVKFKVKKGKDGAYEDAAAAAVSGKTLTLVVDDDYSVKCEASNGILDLVTREAIINRIVPAKITGALTQSPLPATVGTSFNVTCPVEPNMAEVTWSKNGVEVGKDKTLTLTAARADLGALVVCHAQVDDPAAGVDDAGVSANLTLEVSWPATTDSVEDGKADENGVITTTIVVSGNPTPNVTVNTLNGTLNSSQTIDGTEVTVKLVYKEADLPIEYQVLVEGMTEPVTSAKILAPTSPTPTEPPTEKTPANNAGTIAGIIIAVILICICAALLTIMWKKNLLCPKKGSLDVEKGTTGSSDGGITKPVELEEVEPQVHEPVEETQKKAAAPLLDDDDIKKPTKDGEYIMIE